MKSEKEKYLKDLYNLQKYSKYAILGAKEALNICQKRKRKFPDKDSFEVYKHAYYSVLYHVFMGGDKAEIFPPNPTQDDAVRKILMCVEENRGFPQEYMENLLDDIKHIKMEDRQKLFGFLEKSIKGFRYKCGITEAIERDSSMGKIFMQESQMQFMVRLGIEKIFKEKSKT